jgi:hypothetical protein
VIVLADITHQPIKHQARRLVATDRIAGVGALLFAAIVVVQNAIRASAPAFGSAATAVTDYFDHHRVAALVPLGLFPLGMIAILSFAAGVRSRAHEPAARWWADVGSLAAVAVAGLFAVVNLVEITIAADGSDLASAPRVVSALWALHGAAFALNLAAIAVALLGLSRAALAAGLIPSWLGVLSLPAAACLCCAAAGNVAIAEGSRWLYVAFPGFAVWTIFLLAAGAALVRSRAGNRTEAVS